MALVTLLSQDSNLPDLPEISESEDSVGEDREYFTSSISSLMKAPEPRSCCCPSIREKLFPTLETKMFKIMQKEDFLPDLKKFRECIKNTAKLQRFYVGLIPFIINNPQIFYDVGIENDASVLSPLLAEVIDGMVDSSEKVTFFLQLYKLEKRHDRLPLLTRYFQEYEDFDLFEDERFLRGFHNKSDLLNKDLLLKLIEYLKKKGKLFECIEILTLLELQKTDDILFRSTNLLSKITATYGAQVFSSLLKSELNLVEYLSDIDDLEFLNENEEENTHTKEKRRKSTESGLDENEGEGIFKNLGKKEFSELEETKQRFLVLVHMVFLQLFSHPFPKKGAYLLMQRKEILERKGYDSNEVNIYLGELLFLRIINPHLTNSKIGQERKAVVQLAKALQAVANNTIYEDINHLSWMNPFLGEFSDQFDEFIANLDESKEEVL